MADKTYNSTYEIDLDILEAVKQGGGGGGNIPEAPKDGSTYGRKDGTWAKVTGGGDYVVVSSLDEVSSPKDGTVAHIDGKGDYVYDNGKWWWQDILIDELTNEERAAYVAQLMDGDFYLNVKSHPNRIKRTAWDTRVDSGYLVWGGDTVYGFGNSSNADKKNIFMECFFIRGDGIIDGRNWGSLPFLNTESPDGQYALKKQGGLESWAKVEGGAGDGKTIIHLENDTNYEELFNACAAKEAEGEGKFREALDAYDIYSTIDWGLQTLSDAYWGGCYDGNIGLKLHFYDAHSRIDNWEIWASDKCSHFISTTDLSGGGGKELVIVDNVSDEQYNRIMADFEAAYNAGDWRKALEKYDFVKNDESEERAATPIEAEWHSGVNWLVLHFQTPYHMYTAVFRNGAVELEIKGDDVWGKINAGGSSKEIIYLNGRSQEEYVELFNRLRPEMLAGNFHNFEFYWQITGESSVDRAILMDNVDVSQENWLVFGGNKTAFGNPRVTVQAAIQNDGVCYYEEVEIGSGGGSLPEGMAIEDVDGERRFVSTNGNNIVKVFSTEYGGNVLLASANETTESNIAFEADAVNGSGLMFGCYNTEDWGGGNIAILANKEKAKIEIDGKPVVTMMQLTQAEYDALETKDTNTLYIITD